MQRALVGIDIGGTKISICIGDSSGAIYASTRIATKSVPTWQKGCKAILETIHHLLEKLSLEKSAIASMGISAPGPLSVVQGKILSPPNLPGWENAPIAQELQKKIKAPIFFNNDANAQVLAEHLFGAYRKAQNLIYLTCSTGIGAGILLNGKLVQGASDTAGEVGHFTLDTKGPSCPCGQKGCFEVYCGGANFRKTIQHAVANEKKSGVILQEAGGKIDQIDLPHFAKALRKKDPLAKELWEEFTTRMAQGIGILLMTLNPEVLILGTIALHMEDLLFPFLEKKLPLFCWDMPKNACKIAVASLKSEISELAGLALACGGSGLTPYQMRK